MKTRLVGIKEFRNNLTKFSKETHMKDVHFVVMRHSKPLFKVSPLTQEELELEALREDIEAARSQVKAGEVYSSEEVRAMLGL